MATYRILMLALGGLVASISLAHASAIPPAYQQVAQSQGVPASILYAISMNESKKKLASGHVRPWPWTLNVKGKSYFYPTREQACEALHQFTRHYPLKNIDVGIAQVNIGWNGVRFFKRHCDGFEPRDNLRVASIILKECFQKHGDWVSAAGCYHHPKGGSPARRYKAGIRAHLAQIHGRQVVSSKNQMAIARSKVVTPVAEEPKNFTWVKPDDSAVVWVAPQG